MTSVRPAYDEFTDTTVQVAVSMNAAGELRLVDQSCLVVLAGSRIGQRVALGERRLLIGRGAANGLVLDADSVSRQHAAIEWDGRRHIVVDLDSTNGTFVNDGSVSRCALADSDRVQIGKVLLKYLSGSNIESAYHAEIQRLARFDGLTGAANRGHFEELLERELELGHEHGLPVGFLLFDLDHFKLVNDTYGHPAGDAVLRQVVALLRTVLDSELLLGRLGGEEFGVLCPGYDDERCRAVAEAIRLAVQGHDFELPVGTIKSTVSVGVAVADPEQVVLPNSLFARADQSLYAAKAQGRNRVV
jgi:two-component system cell cycle response regulator